MKVALYARVSTNLQESLNQVSELRDFAVKRGWEIAREYVDEDVRGKQSRKPQLEALLHDAHRGEFELVTFWSLDRLTRAGPDDAADILGRINAAGCDFVSYREEAINSLGPWKRALIDLLAIVANFESQRASERIRAGLTRVRGQGRRLGRPRADLHGLSGPDVVALRVAGLSWAQIEEKTGLSSGTLRRLAKITSQGNG
jgi:DNA invertase Pin-like site-specific DNA recombinase